MNYELQNIIRGFDYFLMFKKQQKLIAHMGIYIGSNNMLFTYCFI